MKISYKIINSSFDDFIGQNGFIQLEFNGYTYGEIYSEEYEMVAEKESLYDWFDRLVRVAQNILTRRYVFLSDVESYNTWLEFKRENERDLVVSIIQAYKEDGASDIEFYLSNRKYGKWSNQKVILKQFVNEIIINASEYVEYLINHNQDTEIYVQLKDNIDNLKKLVS